MPRQREDLTGRTFGRLTVLEFAGVDKGRRSLWRCGCECGRATTVQGSNLKDGRTASCGCLRAEMAPVYAVANPRTHGQTGTRMHRIWMRMIQRTTDPNYPGWKDYGGRGITMCPEWRSFEAFARDMVPTYHDDLTIERNDVNGNYEPGNCRWATTKEQNRNRRDTVRATVWGVEKPLADWCDLFGVNLRAVRQRIRRYGWDPERALTTDADPEAVAAARHGIAA